MVELRQRARDAVTLSFRFLIFFNSKGDVVQLKEPDIFHTENITVECRRLGALLGSCPRAFLHFYLIF